MNAAGTSPKVRLVSRPPKPLAPQNFSAVATGKLAGRLSWKPVDVKEIAGWEYRVKTGSTKSGWSKLTEVAVGADGTLSAAITGKSNCAPCTYYLRAYNDSGRSSLVKDEAHLVAPTWSAEITQSVQSDRVTLTWVEDRIDLTGYQYRLGQGEWVAIPFSKVTVDGDSRSWTLTGLSSATSYTLAIRAVNPVGVGQGTSMTVVIE